METALDTGHRVITHSTKLTLVNFLDLHVCGSLSQREKRYISYRQQDVFGFGVNEKTYRDISASEGVSAARIREIVLKAKRKIEYALYLASQRMKDPHVVVKEVAKEDMIPNLPLRQKWIYDLGPLSVRTWNCLNNSDLLLIDRLLEKSPVELLRQPNFGRKSLREVEELLAQHGLVLNPQRDHQYYTRDRATDE